jgi:lysophospholipase L1-like esterase
MKCPKSSGLSSNPLLSLLAVLVNRCGGAVFHSFRVSRYDFKMEKIATYICLGDSMSIDCYPHYELALTRPAVSQSVGAASLLYRNDKEVWPEFEHRDLLTANPSMRICNLTEDGATTFDFLDTDYLKLLKGVERQPSLITVTLGGNDMLRTLSFSEDQMASESENILARFNKVIDTLSQELPRAIFILTTVYDPTDGTGNLEGFGNIKLQLKWLDFINAGIKSCASRKFALLADVHQHFLGHGVTAPEDDRWYWKPNPIEPGARGASEIRRLWYELAEKECLF